NPQHLHLQPQPGDVVGGVQEELRPATACRRARAAGAPSPSSGGNVNGVPPFPSIAKTKSSATTRSARPRRRIAVHRRELMASNVRGEEENGGVSAL
ncbi:hypothetical protein BHM03_00060368, partial [Ensete ventricosum]